MTFVNDLANRLATVSTIRYDEGIFKANSVKYTKRENKLALIVSRTTITNQCHKRNGRKKLSTTSNLNQQQSNAHKL